MTFPQNAVLKGDACLWTEWFDHNTPCYGQVAIERNLKDTLARYCQGGNKKRYF